MMHWCSVSTVIFFLCFSLSSLFGPFPSVGRDTMTESQPIEDGETLISVGRIFELGFYAHSIVAIWYHNSGNQTPVWMANRKNPIDDSPGAFRIGEDGNLQVLDVSRNVVWSTTTNVSAGSSGWRSATLLDSGNLVLMDEGSRILWQSFDHPTDTLLPGMILGINLKTGQNRVLSTWRGYPSRDFTFGLDPQAMNQFLIWRGSFPYWRSIYRNGGAWNVIPEGGLNRFNLSFVSNEEEVYFMYSPPYTDNAMTHISARLVMSLSGTLDYMEERNGLFVSASLSGRPNRCEQAICGENSSCNDDRTPLCECLPGFEPNSPMQWSGGNWENGCKSRDLACGTADEFFSFRFGTSGWGNGVITLTTVDECKASCVRRCECKAYSHNEVEGNGTVTCWSWDGGVGLLEQQDGEQYYIRLRPQEVGAGGRQCPNCGGKSIPYPLSTGPHCGDPAFNSRFHCSNSTNQLYFRAPNGISYEVTRINSTTRSFIVQPNDASGFCKNGSGSGNIHLNSSEPFYITRNNTIVFLNCSTYMQLLPLHWDCSSSSPCQKYMQDGPASCFNLQKCCSYNMADVSSKSYSVNISSSGCSSYASFVGGMNVGLPISWVEGIEIGWEDPPEPECNSMEECSPWPESTCSPDKVMIGKKRCFCNVNFSWDASIQNCTFDPSPISLKGHSHLSNKQTSSHTKKVFHLLVPVITTIGSFTLSICLYFLWKLLKQRESGDDKRKFSLPSFNSGVSDVEDFLDANIYGKELQITLFDLRTITMAISDFSDSNKLGEGGFGPVFKGSLPGGQDIAVKRLSKNSGQGLKEFKNEVVLVGKLQHKNLVRVIGYCAEGNEKMLIYEYMPNKSLDTLLFDPNQCKRLDWDKRFNIILGIARGLLYLHRDSRLPIIHRDLKTSNILLDKEMSPKISDFGMARIFRRSQSAECTEKVAGTYGYMAPEYALHGSFSVKSDVFSFGVILLEIVSGRKASNFHDAENSLTLLGQAWRLWKEDKVLDFMDPSIGQTCNRLKVLRSIHVGLLCVQENAADRPDTATVVGMVDSETAPLPAPKQPAFVFSSPSNTKNSPIKPEMISVNEVTISTMEGR